MSLSEKKFPNLKSLILGSLLILLFIGLIITGWQWWTEGRFVETTDNAYVEADVTAIAPKVSGYVSRILVEENSRVQTGQILFTIEDREFIAQVSRMRARADVNKARIDTLTTQLKLQKSFIAQAKANMASAKAERFRAQSDLERYRVLQKDRAASRQKLDLAVANAEKAKAGIEAARALFEAQRNKLDVLKTQRIEAEAVYKEARAQLQLAEFDLENTVIRAPVDGLLGNRHLGIGQYLRPGMQVFSLVPLPDVYVKANFKETQVEHMRIGQSVTLSVDSFSNDDIEGIVESFAPASGSRFSLLPPENATGNFTKITQRIPVRIKILKTGIIHRALRPGMSVTVSVDTKSGGNLPETGQGLAEASRPTPAKTSLESLDANLGK